MDSPQDMRSEEERRYAAMEREIVERVRRRHHRHTRNVLIAAVIAGAAGGWALSASSHQSLEQCIADNVQAGDRNSAEEAMELLRRMDRSERAESQRR